MWNSAERTVVQQIWKVEVQKFVIAIFAEAEKQISFFSENTSIFVNRHNCFSNENYCTVLWRKN